MSRITSTACDFCGKKKEQTNHWWVLAIVIDNGGRRSLVISDNCGVVHDGQSDACGEKCVSIGVSRFLDHGDLAG